MNKVELSLHRKAKRTQKETADLNSKMTEIKNSLDGFIDRFEQAEERISELKGKTTGIIESEEQKKNIMQKNE